MLFRSELSVGVLLVETAPRRAHISIDDRDIGITPKSISNLPPGEIKVSLAKEGYKQWQKRVTIEPTEITELRDIRLFPSDPARQTLLNNVTMFSLAPNRRLLSAVADDTLHVIDEDGMSIMRTATLQYPLNRLLWSPDSSNILLLGRRQTSLVNITARSNPQPLPKLTGIKEVTWDPRIPGRLLVLMPDGTLEAYQIATGVITKLASNVFAFATSSRNIFTVTSDQRQIDTLNLQGQLTGSRTFNKQIKRLLISPGGYTAIWYTDDSLAALNEQDELISIAKSVQKAGFSPDARLLYVQTDDTSLHVYNARDERLPYIPLNDLRLIVRLSRPIRDPQWFAGGRNLIYQVGDEIIITEIDTRDHPISYTVDSTNLGDTNATVGQDGKSLFYLKRINGSTQLVSTRLTVE